MNQSKNSFRRKQLVASVISVVAMGSTGGAWSQDGAVRTLEEVVVTAQKRAQSVQDIPITINAFDANDLRDRGIDDFSQLGVLVPGLNLRPSTGFFDPVVTIRGIGLRFSEPNVSPSVAVYVDEVFMATPRYMNTPLFDLERVEVLKGPQGTLFGQNTTAGAINFITRKPTEEREGYVDISYGKFNELDVEGAIGGALSTNLMGRLSMKYTESDGHQKNLGTTQTAGFTRAPGVIPGVPDVPATSDYAGLDKLSVRGGLTFTPTDDLEIFTSLHYFKDESEIPIVKLEGPDALGVEPLSDDPFTVESDELPRAVDHEQWGGQIRLDWDLGLGTFTSLTGYETFDRRLMDPDGSAMRILGQDFNNESYLFMQEFRLVSSDNDLVNWTLGANYSEDEVDFFKIQDASDLVLGGLLTEYVREVSGWSLFGQAEWNIAQDWRLTTGLRYLEEERSIDRSSIELDFWGVSQVGLVFPEIPLIAKDSIDAQETPWKVGLDWTPNDALLVYGSVSFGYKSGGFDGSGIATSAALEPFDGEEVMAYELGIKYDASTLPLRINASVFRYDYDNLQAQTTVMIGSVTDLILANAGQAEINGAEIDFNWSPVAGLTLTAGATLIDSEITDFNSSDVSQAEDIIGNKVPGTPDLTYNLSLAYMFSVADFEVRAVADYTYTDEVFSDLENTTDFRIDDYELLNARVQLSSIAGPWSVGVWGRNLTDETYYTSAFYAFGSETLRRTYGLPRTYGIDFRYEF